MCIFLIKRCLFFFRSCKSDSTVKSISRLPSNRSSSKWQRTVGAQLAFQNEIPSPVEDAEVFIMNDAFPTVND